MLQANQLTVSPSRHASFEMATRKMQDGSQQNHFKYRIESAFYRLQDVRRAIAQLSPSASGTTPAIQSIGDRPEGDWAMVGTHLARTSPLYPVSYKTTVVNFPQVLSPYQVFLPNDGKSYAQLIWDLHKELETDCAGVEEVEIGLILIESLIMRGDRRFAVHKIWQQVFPKPIGGWDREIGNTAVKVFQNYLASTIKDKKWDELFDLIEAVVPSLSPPYREPWVNSLIPDLANLEPGSCREFREALAVRIGKNEVLYRPLANGWACCKLKEKLGQPSLTTNESLLVEILDISQELQDNLPQHLLAKLLEAAAGCQFSTIKKRAVGLWLSRAGQAPLETIALAANLMKEADPEEAAAFFGSEVFAAILQKMSKAKMRDVGSIYNKFYSQAKESHNPSASDEWNTKYMRMCPFVLQCRQADALDHLKESRIAVPVLRKVILDLETGGYANVELWTEALKKVAESKSKELQKDAFQLWTKQWKIFKAEKACPEAWAQASRLLEPSDAIQLVNTDDFDEIVAICSSKPKCMTEFYNNLVVQGLKEASGFGALLPFYQRHVAAYPGIFGSEKCFNVLERVLLQGLKTKDSHVAYQILDDIVESDGVDNEVKLRIYRNFIAASPVHINVDVLRGYQDLARALLLCQKQDREPLIDAFEIAQHLVKTVTHKGIQNENQTVPLKGLAIQCALKSARQVAKARDGKHPLSAAECKKLDEYFSFICGLIKTPGLIPLIFLSPESLDGLTTLHQRMTFEQWKKSGCLQFFKETIVGSLTAKRNLDMAIKRAQELFHIFQYTSEESMHIVSHMIGALGSMFIAKTNAKNDTNSNNKIPADFDERMYKAAEIILKIGPGGILTKPDLGSRRMGRYYPVDHLFDAICGWAKLINTDKEKYAVFGQNQHEFYSLAFRLLSDPNNVESLKEAIQSGTVDALVQSCLDNVSFDPHPDLNKQTTYIPFLERLVKFLYLNETKAVLKRINEGSNAIKMFSVLDDIHLHPLLQILECSCSNPSDEEYKRGVASKLATFNANMKCLNESMELTVFQKTYIWKGVIDILITISKHVDADTWIEQMKAVYAKLLHFIECETEGPPTDRFIDDEVLFQIVECFGHAFEKMIALYQTLDGGSPLRSFLVDLLLKMLYLQVNHTEHTLETKSKLFAQAYALVAKSDWTTSQLRQLVNCARDVCFEEPLATIYLPDQMVQVYFNRQPKVICTADMKSERRRQGTAVLFNTPVMYDNPEKALKGILFSAHLLRLADFQDFANDDHFPELIRFFSDIVSGSMNFNPILVAESDLFQTIFEALRNIVNKPVDLFEEESYLDGIDSIQDLFGVQQEASVQAAREFLQKILSNMAAICENARKASPQSSKEKIDANIECIIQFAAECKARGFIGDGEADLLMGRLKCVL